MLKEVEVIGKQNLHDNLDNLDNLSHDQITSIFQKFKSLD